MICTYWKTGSDRWPHDLRAALSSYHPQLVPFSSRRQLADLALQTMLDMVVIPVEGNVHRALELGLKVKSIPALSVVPVVLWLSDPDPDPETVIAILDSSIDDVVVGAGDDPAAAARL